MTALPSPRDAPWDLVPYDRGDWFSLLPDGLVTVLPGEALDEDPGPGVDPLADGGAWIHVGADGAVTAFTGKVDVGQDNRTALMLLVAEELRVGAEDVRGRDGKPLRPRVPPRRARARLGLDAVDLRLRNLRDERLVAVIQAAVERFGWAGPRGGDGGGSGVAYGGLRVLRIVTALECGGVVNPGQPSQPDRRSDDHGARQSAVRGRALRGRADPQSAPVQVPRPALPRRAAD